MIAIAVPLEVWTFPSDLSARRRFFDPCVFAHPAKLHLGLLQKLIDIYTAPGDTILDPMAGTGSLMLAATQQRNVVLRDLESEYVAMMQRSASVIRTKAGLFAGLIDIDQADARTLDCATFNHVITSPPYGFETGKGITPQREALLATKGPAWLNKIGDTSGAVWLGGFRYVGGQSNAGNKSGRNYWRDMTAIYERLAFILPPGGKLILILKNHYRRGKLIDIVSRSISTVEQLGLYLVARHARYIDNPSIWQRRRKERGMPIVENEDVLVFSIGESK